MSISDTPDGKLRASQRKAERRKVLLGGRVAHLDGGFFTRCLLTSISQTGAAIRLEDSETIPDLVYLFDLRSNMVHEAQVKWRKSPKFGLEFVRSHSFSDAPTRELRRLIAGLPR